MAINCKSIEYSAHNPNHKQFLQQKELNKIMELENIPYKEGNQKCKENYNHFIFNNQVSYAQALTSTPKSELTIQARVTKPNVNINE